MSPRSLNALFCGCRPKVLFHTAFPRELDPVRCTFLAIPVLFAIVSWERDKKEEALTDHRPNDRKETCQWGFWQLFLSGRGGAEKSTVLSSFRFSKCAFVCVCVFDTDTLAALPLPGFKRSVAPAAGLGWQQSVSIARQPAAPNGPAAVVGGGRRRWCSKNLWGLKIGRGWWRWNWKRVQQRTGFSNLV